MRGKGEDLSLFFGLKQCGSLCATRLEPKARLTSQPVLGWGKVGYLFPEGSHGKFILAMVQGELCSVLFTEAGRSPT